MAKYIKQVTGSVSAVYDGSGNYGYSMSSTTFYTVPSNRVAKISGYFSIYFSQSQTGANVIGQLWGFPLPTGSGYHYFVNRTGAPNYNNPQFSISTFTIGDEQVITAVGGSGSFFGPAFYLNAGESVQYLGNYNYSYIGNNDKVMVKMIIIEEDTV
jgi:hypothetical protein